MSDQQIYEKSDNYDLISRLNHWGIALLIIGMLIFGFYIEFVVPRGPEKGALFGIHKSIGVLVLILGSWRVLWRLMQGFKSDIGTPPKWQSFLAKLVHWILLVGIIVMPLSGLMGSIFGGRAVEVFGWFTIPAATKVESISGLAYQIHGMFAFLMVAAIALHIAGALKHQIVDKDRTMARMTGRS